MNNKNPKQSIINQLSKLGYEKFYLLGTFRLALSWLYNSRVLRNFIKVSSIIVGVYILGLITMNFKITSNELEIKSLSNKISYYGKALINLHNKIDDVENHINSISYLRTKYQTISGVPIPNNIDSIALVTMINTAHFHAIPERLYFRWLYKEANFNPYAISHKNAIGYGQIIKSTFYFYNLHKLYNFENPIDNIKASGYILARHYKQYGNWELALAAYNGGDGVIINNKICNCSGIKDYVQFILK